MHESNERRFSYGNFNNPLGLVSRMLRSGNRAAYSALFREALGIGLKPADLLLSLFERRRSVSSESSSNNQPLILIVGPPRSGTTLIYQVLAHCLDVSYASNLMGLFPRSPLTATRLFGRFVSPRPVADFRSYFGQSSRLSGPHDGFFIWNRWLGEDRYAPKGQLTASESEKMREFFARWATEIPTPFLNKNNRNANCIDLLARELPSARFLVVRRDPAAIVRSLIRAREQVQGDRRAPWGLLSSAESDHELGYVDDVCRQVMRIEQRLDEQVAVIDPDRIVGIRYEDFCENPKALVARLAESIPNLTIASGIQQLSDFRCSTGRLLSEDEEERIRLHITELNSASLPASAAPHDEEG